MGKTRRYSAAPGGGPTLTGGFFGPPERTYFSAADLFQGDQLELCAPVGRDAYLLVTDQHGKK